MPRLVCTPIPSEYIYSPVSAQLADDDIRNASLFPISNAVFSRVMHNGIFPQAKDVPFIIVSGTKSA